MEAAQTVQTRQMRVIPSLSQLDRKRAAEAKEKWEKNRTPVLVPVPPVSPADGAPMLIPQPQAAPTVPPAPTVIAPAAVTAKLRVAAYCRVSTGSVEQETSIENQRVH